MLSKVRLPAIASKCTPQPLGGGLGTLGKTRGHTWWQSLFLGLGPEPLTSCLGVTLAGPLQDGSTPGPPTRLLAWSRATSGRTGQS